MTLHQLADRLSEFATIIEWDESSVDFQNNAIIPYEKACSDNFAVFAAHVASTDVPGHQELADIVDTMSDAQLAAYCRLPYVVEAVRYSEEEALPSTVAYLTLLALGMTLDGDRDCDDYAPSALRGVPVSVRRSTIAFPLNISGIVRWSEPPVEYAPDAADRVFDKVENALALIHEEETIAGFVSSFTAILGIRECRERPNVVSSGTFRGMIGLTALTNPHLDRIDRHYLADALVHESIHTAMYMLEYLVGCNIATKDDASRIIQSPWSGADISVDNLIQAVFVWYGLYHLWKKIEQRNAAEASVVRKYKTRAYAGFEKLDGFLTREGLYDRDEVCRLLSRLAATVTAGQSWRGGATAPSEAAFAS